jgi:hypothetical protein
MFAIFAFALSLVQLLRSVISQPKGPEIAEQEFSAPTAEAGGSVPVFWGVAEVAPNTVWWGRLQRSKRKQYFYSITQHLLLCWGVVNEIIDISFADKSTRNHLVFDEPDTVFEGLTNTGDPVDFVIYGNMKARSPELSDNPMFGGDEQGGGVGADVDTGERGRCHLYWGFNDATKQPVDAVLDDEDIYDDRCSRWPGFVHMRMGSEDGTSFYVASGSATPPAMKLLMRRTAWWEDFDEGGLSPLGQTPSEATIRHDANPAEILYDLLTHKGYGVGRSPDGLDLDSFVAVAETLRDEVITAEKTGFGISVAISGETEAGSVIQQILNHIDATLCTNPVTGKLRLKLIRPDYDVEDLPRITASNSRAHRYAPSTYAETVNEVQVKYRRFVNDENTRGFVDDIASHQDGANWQATGGVRSAVFELPFITDPDVAALCAARHGRAGAIPLARYGWTMNREGYALMPGDAVVAEESAFGVADLVLRVTSIDYGTLEDGAITVEGVQDVFSATQATYTPPASGWTEPEHGDTEDESGEGSTPEDAGDVDWDPEFYG